MKLKKLFLLISILASGCYSVQLVAQDASELSRIQQRWAEVNYQLEGKMQLSAFEELIEETEKLSDSQPNSAEIWIWSGIIKSTYAGAKGGLGALGMAKQAKADLERAMTIDADALAGSSYTSLGTLYHSVPGWPVGFGNQGKAEELLLKALTLNPDGIDTNYFFGTYLLDEKRYDEAEKYLLRAKAAPARANRPVADAGRQQEISVALELLNKKR
jgi:tetratricopeptide (TPR) repeat protein